jgi:NAD(P)-dependent dehydrogenase (short-subunit alcohol dehydrogenase family)
MELGLTGSTVVVTGGGGGIGRAAALALSREGASVLVADQSLSAAEITASLVRETGGDVRVKACDVSHASAAEALVAAAASMGQVSGLVNAFGVAQPQPAPEITVENWHVTINTNLTGTWLLCQAFIRHWNATSNPGSIVNLASNNAFYAEPKLAAYCASKGGITALTRALALECGPSGIRVNAVCPGFVDTPLLGLDTNDADSRANLGLLHALHRIAQPAEIAQTIAFLVSECSSFTTGAAVVVDGGMSIGVHGVPAA